MSVTQRSSFFSNSSSNWIKGLSSAPSPRDLPCWGEGLRRSSASSSCQTRTPVRTGLRVCSCSRTKRVRLRGSEQEEVLTVLVLLDSEEKHQQNKGFIFYFWLKSSTRWENDKNIKNWFKSKDSVFNHKVYIWSLFIKTEFKCD